MKIDSALNFTNMMNMPFIELAKIVVTDHYTPEDRFKACQGVHARAPKETNGAGWLALSLEEKAIVRKAMEYDTTGEGLRSA
jgi:hypothetical protein